MAGQTGPQLPGIDIKTEIKLPPSTPAGPPTSPILIGIGGKVAVKGSAVYGHPATKVAFTVGKTQADFEQKAKTEWGEVKIKGQVKPGEVSKIGLEFISKDYPVTVEFAANADFTQPFLSMNAGSSARFLARILNGGAA